MSSAETVPQPGEGSWSSITTTESRWSSVIVAATSVSGVAGGQVTTPACIASATLIESSRVLGEPPSANVGARLIGTVSVCGMVIASGSRRISLRRTTSRFALIPAPGWSSRRQRDRVDVPLRHLEHRRRRPTGATLIPDRSIAEREKRLRLLLDVGRSLVSELELDVVLERVLEAGRELTGARYAAIGVLDGQRNALERFITLGIDDETHRAIGDLPRGRGVLGVLITEPQPLRIDDVGRHPRSYGFPPAHPPMHSFLGVPIRVRDQVYGNLYLTEKDGGVFDLEDEEVVVVLAEWAAVAIDNARSYASAESRRIELERAVAGLEATTAIAQTLAGETELESVLELIVKRGRALADARAMVVMLPRGNGLVVSALAGDLDHGLLGVNVALDGSVSGHVFRSGRAERFSDASNRLLGTFEKQTDASAGLFVPLLFRGRVSASSPPSTGSRTWGSSAPRMSMS